MDGRYAEKYIHTYVHRLKKRTRNGRGYGENGEERKFIRIW